MCSCKRQLLSEKEHINVHSLYQREELYLGKSRCRRAMSMAHCAAPSREVARNKTIHEDWASLKYAFSSYCYPSMYDNRVREEPFRTGVKARWQNWCSSCPNRTKLFALPRRLWKNSPKHLRNYLLRKGSYSALLLSLCLLFEILSSVPVKCQTTVTNTVNGANGIQCSPGCMCIYGEDSRRVMGAILKDDRQRDTWERLKKENVLTSLPVIFCTDSDYETVPRGIKNNTGILYLDDNRITSLTSYGFLQHRNDVNIPTLLLSLSSNRISHISGGAFRGLTNLKILILRNNSIADLNWNIAASSSFQFLRELDLSWNNIKSVQTDNFSTLPNLRRLDLSNNVIEFMDARVLLNFPNLEHLDLSSNKLSYSSFQFTETLSTSVRFVSLGGNLISDIRPIVFGFLSRFPNLDNLDISRNLISSGRLESISFEDLSSIKKLNLSGCGIVMLDQGWLNGGLHINLEVLDLSHNFLRSISAHALSIVFTADLNATPSHDSPHRTKVILHDVTSTDVPPLTEQNSFSLDFSVVPKEKVEMKWLRPLTNLHTLILSNNRQLVTIEDDTFDFLPRLRNLFLQDCSIRRLNVASARYRYGAQALSQTLPELANIWVHGNPLDCNCYIRVLRQWSDETNNLPDNHSMKHHVDATSYIENDVTVTMPSGISSCATPLKLQGVQITTSSGVSMTCPEEPHSILIAMLIGPLTFATSILLTIMCGSCHVCIMKMKKGAVLSYHAREDEMRTPRRKRRRNPPDPILSPIPWNRPSPQEDNYGNQSPSLRQYSTNLVLGKLASRSDDRNRQSTSSHGLGVIGRMGTSMSSLDVAGGNYAHSRQSAGYCSGTENNNNHCHIRPPILVVSAAPDKRADFVKYRRGSETDSVLGKESVRTRSHSSDIPFIDIHDYAASKVDGHYTRHRSASIGSDTALTLRQHGSCDLGREHSLSFSTLPGNSHSLRHRNKNDDAMKSGDIERCRSHGLLLPGPSNNIHFEEETCL